MICWNRELIDHINARVSKKFHAPLANEASVSLLAGKIVLMQKTIRCIDLLITSAERAVSVCYA